MGTKNRTADLDKSKSSRPSQPVASFLQEAENLYIWCVDDIPELLTAGIDEAIINELPQSIETCRRAQTMWNKKLKTPGEIQKKWKNKVSEAIEFRKELLRSMRFAFRRQPDLSTRLKAISKGRGYAGLIQGLNNLSVLGRANEESLLKIGFDLDILNTAAAKSEELAGLWALRNNEKEELKDAAVYRNQAYWRLQEKVNEIRSTGQYVFRHRKDRYIGYVSIFWKQKHSRRSSPGN